VNARPIAALVASALLVGCLGTLQIAKQIPEPPPPPVPDRFRAEHAPELVPSEVDGCQAAPTLDSNLYYCAKDEHWYRFAMNRWYLAFAWDGNWFPASGAELPQGLRKITPKTQAETEKTREERLEELEKKLEELDGEQQEP
jgi:hypothetical protein